VEDAAEQLLRRTGACWCQCVLRPGRRSEIDRQDRVRMLVTNVGGASYHSEVLRVIAVGGLQIGGRGPNSKAHPARNATVQETATQIASFLRNP
jgi:hypothetical protein